MAKPSRTSNGGNGDAVMTLEQIVHKVENSDIGSIKNVAAGIIKIINNPEATAKDLKEIVEIDPPLSAKVLKLANSAYYYSKVHINDIEQAVIWIGFDNLKELALNQKVCEVFLKDSEVVAGYSREALWKHSVSVALLGKKICRMEFGERGENAYAVGILHDIGVIAEDQFMTRKLEQALMESLRDERPLASIERDLFGYDHADIGGGVTERWQFPSHLVDGVRFHHNPAITPSDNLIIACVLRLADFLCHENGLGFLENYHTDMKSVDFALKTLDVDLLSLNLIVEDVRDEIQVMREEGFF